MGKFIKILFYIFLLSFAYLWMSTVIKSCNNPVPNSIKVGEDLSATGNDSDGDDGYFEDGETSDDYEFDEANANTNNDSDNDIDYDQVDETLENEESTSDTGEVDYEEPAPRNNTTVTSNTSSYGRYLVITGSYLVRSNAESMSSKLSRMGYNDAEIVVFNNSQYNSVVASRYDDYASAIEAANALKRKGVDAYVHTKK